MPVIAGVVLLGSGPVDGATCTAYRAALLPAGGPTSSTVPPGVAAAPSVQTSTINFGALGNFRITVPTEEDHYVYATYGGGFAGWQGPYPAVENLDLLHTAASGMSPQGIDTSTTPQSKTGPLTVPVLDNGGEGSNIQGAGLGADPTNTIDATAIINSAIGNDKVVIAPKGNYKTTGTVNFASRFKWRGNPGGKQDPGTTNFGTVLKYSGAVNGTLARIVGQEFVEIDGLHLDGGGIGGGTGLLIDSTNAPATRQATLRNISVSDVGATGVNGTGVQFAQPGSVTDYQMDAIKLERFEIQNTFTGIRIDSYNALSLSEISHGVIRQANRGIYLVRCGPMAIRHVTFGLGSVGTAPACIDVASQDPLLLDDCQSEGPATTLFLRTSGNSTQTITILNCNVDQSIEIHGTRNVVLIGGNYTQSVKLFDGASIESYNVNFSGGAGIIRDVSSTGDIVIHDTRSGSATLSIASQKVGALMQAVGAANGLQIVGSPTSGPGTLQAIGSDANVGVQLLPKGGSPVTVSGPLAVTGQIYAGNNILDGSGSRYSLVFLNPAGAVNYPIAVSSIAGSASGLQVGGNDFNIDLALTPKGTGAVRAVAAPFAAAQSASAPALATGGTITTANVGMARVAPAAAVTGVILQAGTVAGQQVTVVNESAAANSVTFAAAPGGNVADGAASPIAGLTSRSFVWDSATALWYRAA